MKPSCLVPLVLLVLLLVAVVIGTGFTGLTAAKGPLVCPPESRVHVPDGTQTPYTISRYDFPDPQTPGPENVPGASTAAARDTLAYHPLRPLRAQGEPVEYRAFSFTYRGDAYSIRIPVNMSLYKAAEESQNKGLAIDRENAGLFYRQLMNDPAMDPFYCDLIREIGRLKYKGGKTLTDDEYLELLVSFVQQIPYENTTRFPRYPIEVIYHQSGDCDEKAVLLAGILAREGYDAALLIFPEMGHATAGIRIHPVNRQPVIPGILRWQTGLCLCRDNHEPPDRDLSRGVRNSCRTRYRPCRGGHHAVRQVHFSDRHPVRHQSDPGKDPLAQGKSSCCRWKAETG